MVALIGACTGPAEDDERVTSTSAASSDEESPAPPAAATPDEPEPPAPAPQPTAIHGFAIERVDVARAEDGTGATVEATDPRALTIRADAWPGRALDPVLHVGQLHFHHYDYPAKGELRYVVADTKLLTPGVEVALQYGEDARSRVVIATSLEVQR